MRNRRFVTPRFRDALMAKNIGSIIPYKTTLDLALWNRARIIAGGVFVDKLGTPVGR